LAIAFVVAIPMALFVLTICGVFALAVGIAAYESSKTFGRWLLSPFKRKHKPYRSAVPRGNVGEGQKPKTPPPAAL
jgi:hypothetical protein